MTNFNVYQTALVVILVLNLVFWILVICFRLFFNNPCGSRDQPRSRRRTPRTAFLSRRSSSNRSLVGIANGVFVNDENSEPYSINGTLEAPPSYEDAIKQTTIMISRRMMPTSHISHQTASGSSQIRRPMVYEQSVVLMVPDESTSSILTETGQMRSVDHCDNTIRRENHIQSTTVSSIATNDDSSIMQDCGFLSPAASDSQSQNDDEQPITFYVSDIGAQCVRMACTTTTVVDLQDGHELATHTQA